ncbi:MAG: hypothetical protein ACJAVI_005058 [Candidatus Azotimanducaceae bacterium]|jgi:hypothetical protein
MRVLKWFAIILTVAVAASFAAFLLLMNPMIVNQIKNKPTSEIAGEALALSFSSGKEIPVNYLREGNQVFVGADGPWWREFENGPTPVKLVIKGVKLTGSATVVLDDPEYTQEIFARLRPTTPGWLPDWLKGKLIVIKLVD